MKLKENIGINIKENLKKGLEVAVSRNQMLISLINNSAKRIEKWFEAKKMFVEFNEKLSINMSDMTSSVQEFDLMVKEEGNMKKPLHCTLEKK
jgi:hypothetical protein